MLAQKLKSLIKSHQLTVPVEITNFHAWCYKQAKIKNILPNSKQNFIENLEQAVITGFQNKTIAAEQYSAVLIDEGHDFKQDWLKILSGMVDSETNYLLFLYDDAQSIYQKKAHLILRFPALVSKLKGVQLFLTSIIEIHSRFSTLLPALHLII